MKAYAAGTIVSVEKTKSEIDTLLGKHGATQRGIMADDEERRAMVAFVIGGRHYRLDVPLPDMSKFADPSKPDWQQAKGITVPRGWPNWGIEKRKQWTRNSMDQSERERWRAVLLMLKAKLELVRIGISTVEREFMADLVLPNGSTVAHMLETQIADVLAGETPRLLGPAS